MASANSLKSLRILVRPNARPFSSASIGRTNACVYLPKHQHRRVSILAAKSHITRSYIVSRPAVLPLTRQRRTFVELKPTGGKTEADLIVEELQDLYNDAKDEFEIAVDSTNSATIYAASDRESAREYLNQLLYVYTAYTFPKDAPAADAEDPSVQLTSPIGEEPNFDPEMVTPEIREEVKKRVGQRIRELRSGVERLEDMAGHEG